jgi:hypothetical protein
MNLVFEDLKGHRNFVECPDINSSTLRRFAIAPLAHSAIHALAFYRKHKMKLEVNSIEFSNNLNLDHYIIPSGVNHHPNDWTGSHLAYNNNRTNSFHYLNPKYVKDLQEGRAMLLFDQSLEGYQTSWLWQYFHEECEKYSIPPEAIIYVTGNTIAETQYKDWANSRTITNKINVIPYTVFEYDVTMIAKEVNLTSNYRANYEYKKNNLEKIKTFNCLQKRLRSHRIWFYKHLVDADLVNSGLVSMNPFDSRQSFFEGKYLNEGEATFYNKDLPKLVNGKNNNDKPDIYYIRRITDDVFLNSWVSVISEAAAGESDETIFLSEKIFKPIICFHPFIVVSNQGYLEKLREMGYKTFNGFIDESYDTLPNVFDRYNAIINSVKKINSIENKLSWFKSLEEILIHNYTVLRKNTMVPNTALYKLQDCYTKYFKLENQCSII